MFEYLGTILVDIDPGFDVLRYLTVRTIGGTVTALLLTIIFGPKLISWLKRCNLNNLDLKEVRILTKKSQVLQLWVDF